jgi:diguanylate cyclase (GGDEF)-like protein
MQREIAEPVDTAGALLMAALDLVGHGLLVLDPERRVVAANDAFVALFGVGRQALRGLRLPALLELAAELAALAPLPEQGVAVWQRGLPDGRTVSVRWAALPDGGWACACEDVTERQHSERRLAHMARHDSLTDLPNRVAFHEALQRALLRQRHGETLAVLCIDLDRFKQVNDALGPRAADEVLRQTSGRLRAIVREGDMVARLGSDEFALIQLAPRHGPPGLGAESMARRVVDAFSRPIDVAGTSIVVSASVGIVLSPAPVAGEPGAEADAMLRRGQLALGHSKQEGRGQWCVFADAMDEAARAHRALEQDLRAALARDEFDLHFQPIVSVRERCVVAFEALLRWNHPTRGMVPPDAFIPLAEELGLIVPIGRWVLRQACATASAWPRSAAGPVRVAVNLSSVQFAQTDLVGEVQAALAESGLDGAQLELEITESVLLGNRADTRETLHRLRRLGARISLDDFGTGYSSLAYLNDFPVDKIKIDKRFVHDIGAADSGSGSEVIVRAIAGLGISLGLTTTAEGVETRAQLDQLIADGCMEMQGYFFSPPRPAAEVAALLDAVARRAA